VAAGAGRALVITRHAAAAPDPADTLNVRLRGARPSTRRRSDT